jgi:PAS domain S-box-containing protein
VKKTVAEHKAGKSETDRVNKIIEAIARAAEGDYSVRIGEAGDNGTLDALAREVNGLIEKTRERIAECGRLESVFTESLGGYRQLLTVMPGMVFIYGMLPDGSKSFPYVSAASRELLGIESDAIMRDESILFALIHHEDRGRVDRSIEESAGTLGPWREEFRIVKEGEVRWYECIAHPERRPEGDIIWDGIMLDITDRKMTEEALGKSEERYRGILDSIEEAYFEVDLKGDVTFFNSSATRNLGFTDDEFMGMNFRQFMDEENAKKADEAFRQVYFSGETNRWFDWEIITKSGKKMSVETSVSLVRDKKGVPTGFRGVVRDISIHKRAEEELFLSAEKYRSLLENIQTSYFELDLKGNLTFCNDIFCRDMGYNHEELLGMNYRSYTKPENVGLIKRTYQEIYRTGKPQTVLNYGVIRKDGSTMIVEQSASMMRGSSGEIIGFQGVGRDVTERHRAEQALRESEEKYRSILETMEEGLFDNDFEGNFTYVNNAACRRLGYERDELIGKNFRMNHTPEMAQRLLEACKRVYQTGKPALLMDFEAIRKNGTVLMYQANITLIRDRSGNPIGFRNLTRDITERMKAEEAMRKSEEKYRTILEIMEEGLFEVDLKGNYTFVNDAACGLMGYERDQMIGMNYRMIHPPETARYLKEVYTRMYATGRLEILREYEAVRKDGSQRMHQSNIAFIRNHAGEIIGFSALARDVTDRKKAEDELRRSEEKFISILETMEEGYAETNLKGHYTFVNEVICRMLGYERNELIESNFRKIHPPEVAQRLKNIYQQIYLTGKPTFLIDSAVIRKDGVIRIHQTNAALMRDQAGNPVGFRTLVRDVTERKKAEDELRRSEEKHRSILENMEELYFENDLKGYYIFVNNTACRLLGYERDELIGKNYCMVYSPETAKLIREQYQKIYETGKSKFLLEHEVIRKDGIVRTHQSNVMLMFDNSGKPIGFRTFGRDVTERKKAEEDLRKSEEKYRSILETMEEGYIENDLNGNYTFVNDAVSRLLGYERDELIGINYSKLHPPEVARRMNTVYRRIYETGKPEFLIDNEIFNKDGTVRIFQTNAALMRDHTGKPIGFRVLARDITELKKAEEEKAMLEERLFQAQKMESVGRLAGGVAHDFNNMLTVILGYAELIRARLPQGDPLLTDMQEIEKAAGRSRDLTRQLLAFSRKEIIAPRTVDLNDMIAGTQKTLLRLIGEDIDLRFYPGVNIWKVKVDPSQMEHILINFAVNARDAMPEGGKLTIETENVHLIESYCKVHPGFSPGHYVLLGVSDDGVGMDRETMGHLFEPFFTTKEKGRGTGLGLATVYGIVKQNEGFINVYSEPGKGTTFKIYIPRSIEVAIAKDEAEETLPTFGTGTVLLVEDDDMVRAITTEMLEATGYTVLSAGSPAEALSFFEKGDVTIDLVITDVVMPGMTGKEMGKKIEAIRPGVRVLFMSGYTTNVIAHRGVLDEGVHFIQKPFSTSDLSRKVREAMSGR